MLKSPVDALEVGPLHVTGDQFANPKHHGTPDAVLYALGLETLQTFFERVDRPLVYGELGENLTLDVLDEREVSVGDIFQIGGVVAQATFPRIPCAKINFRFKHALGQKTMIEMGRSGVYFRILEPGTITMSDRFERRERAPVGFTISEVYERMVGGVKVTDSDRERVHANGAFPMNRVARWFAQA
jgi:MOSC domain-containing protein YiiM